MMLIPRVTTGSPWHSQPRNARLPAAALGPGSAVALQLNTFRVALLFAAMALVVSAAGCNGKSRLAVSPVRGRVVYRGQGVPKAIVIFVPEDDVADKAKKLRPFAYADNQGNFELKTYVDGDGAPPGKYRVSIVAASSGNTGGVTKDQPAGDNGLPTGQGVAIPPAVTQKYQNVDTAGIEVTIHEGENNLEPFVLG